MAKKEVVKGTGCVFYFLGFLGQAGLRVAGRGPYRFSIRIQGFFVIHVLHYKNTGCFFVSLPINRRLPFPRPSAR